MKRKLKRILAALKNPEKLLRYSKWLLEKTKPALPSLGFLLAVDTILILIGFASSFVSKYVVDSATGGLDFWPGFAVMIGINVITILIGAVVNVFRTLINERFAFSIRLKVYDRILEASFLGSSRYHSGDLLTRLTSDVDTIASGVASALPGLLMIMLRLVIAFIILFGYAPFLAVAALILGPVGLLMSFLVGEKLKKLSVEVRECEAAYRSYMQESIAGVTVIKTFCMEDRSRARLADLRQRTLSAILRRNKLSVMMNLCIRVLFSLGYFIAFGYCLYGLKTDFLTYGTMTLFLSLFSQIQQPIMNLSQLLPQVVGVLASAGRVMEIEDIPADPRTGRTETAEKVGLRFTDVDFAYKDEKVLKDVSFTAEPGQIIGIMGPSGAGKTTLIRLVLALTQPNRGTVEFLTDGGTEPASADSRRHIAYVPQGNTLFSGTIAENLRYGNPDATDEELWQALDAAAAEFVRTLPEGLQTPLGEKSAGLSEGQAQRIAIARALLRRSPVLILDEATSALDSDAEEQILSRLAAPDRSYAPLCLIITHRRSMLPYFDRLIEVSGEGAVSVSTLQKT